MSFYTSLTGLNAAAAELAVVSITSPTQLQRALKGLRRHSAIFLPYQPHQIRQPQWVAEYG